MSPLLNALWLEENLPEFDRCARLELSGDTLRVCWAVRGDDYPSELSDQTQRVITLSRHSGPFPKLKKASGKQPVAHTVMASVGDGEEEVAEAEVTEQE